MRTKILFTVLFFCLMLTSCSKQVNEFQRTTEESSKPVSESTISNEQKLIGKKEIIDTIENDINNDGIKDEIPVFVTRQEGSSLINSVGVEIGGKASLVNLDTPTIFSIVKKIETIKLGSMKNGFLVILSDIENENLQDESKYNFVVFDNSSKNPNVILNGINLPINSSNNYILKYIGNYTIELIDNSTSFNAKFNANSSIEGTVNYEKRLEHLNESKDSEMPQSFSDIWVSDIDSDGIDEIICTKFIPGVYHNDTFGIIEYEFKYDNDAFSISKERLLQYEHSGNLVIKEQKFDRGQPI